MPSAARSIAGLLREHSAPSNLRPLTNFPHSPQLGVTMLSVVRCPELRPLNMKWLLSTAKCIFILEIISLKDFLPEYKSKLGAQIFQCPSKTWIVKVKASV